jgi:hypothetical protein
VIQPQRIDDDHQEIRTRSRRLPAGQGCDPQQTEREPASDLDSETSGEPSPACFRSRHAVRFYPGGWEGTRISAMISWDEPLVLRLSSLAALVLLLALRNRIRIPGKVYTIAVAALACLAFLAHTPFVRLHADMGPVGVDYDRFASFHVHDIYHYYIGTKYFKEVGYSGLYEATVIADHEDDPSGFNREAYIRDLRDNANLRKRWSVLLERERIVAPFSEERWREFRGDLDLFRAYHPPIWHSSRIHTDHGYNGTPLTTAVLGLIGNYQPMELAAFIKIIKWLDLYLLLLVTAVIGRFQGWRRALTFAFFWLVNPFNDYDLVGGAYLRYNYFFTLTLAILFFQERKLAWSGFFFAVSSLFRIFPFFFFSGLLAYHLISRDRKSLLEGNRRLYLSFLLTLILTIGATCFVKTPKGEIGWIAFYQRMGPSTPFHAINLIGLKYPFSYSYERSVYSNQPDLLKTAAGVTQQNDYWIEEVPKTFDQRKGWYLLSALSLLALAIFFLSRVAEEETFFLGILLSFVLLVVGQYYYCMLSLVPVIFRKDQRISIALGAFMMLCALAGAADLLLKLPHLQYLLINLLVLFFAMTVLALKIFRPRPS